MLTGSNSKSNQPQSNQKTSQGYGYSQYYPAAYSYGDKADLLDKIKPEFIVNVFMHQLMGERYTNGEWIMDEVLKKRSLSRVGAWEIANLMLSASSQNVSITNLSDDEIRPRALAIAKTAVLACLRNYRLYQIRGRDHLRYIFQIVFTNTMITLKQAEKEGIRALIKGTTSEVRTVSETPNSGGFFSRLLNRRRNN